MNNSFRFRCQALDALRQAELAQAREVEDGRWGQPDELPLPALEANMLNVYPDGDERQDWLRRQLRIWRGQR